MTAQLTVRDDEATAPHDGPVAEVAIPYADGDLPGSLFLVDDSGTARPTIVYTGGIDSTRDRGYAVIGAQALRHGYHFLTYDGPGQGAMLAERGIPLRPDWEHVLGAVVDFARTVPDVDDARIVQVGDGLGGYLAARYASRDHRSAAIVCTEAMTTFYASYPHLPEATLELVEDGSDEEATAALAALMEQDTVVRTRLRLGSRALGADTMADYVRRSADYTLTADDVRRIRTPVLLIEDEHDTVFAGQAANFARAMTAPVRHVVLGDARADGLLQRTVFDHLAR